jgi:hypothetical protein
MSRLPIISKEHIKRPANSFMIWSTEKRQQYLIEKNKNKYKYKNKINNAEMSKLLGQEWKNLPKFFKLKYKEKADIIKREHKLMYPGYKYEPKTKIPKYKRVPYIKKYTEPEQPKQHTQPEQSEQQENLEQQENKSRIYEIEFTNHSIVKKYIVCKKKISKILMSNTYMSNTPTIKTPSKFIKLNDNTNINTFVYTYVNTNTSLDTEFNIMMEHIFADKSYFNVLEDI